MDIDRLVGDLKTLATLLAALKRRVRTPGHRISQLEARYLYNLKARATRLCALRAHVRGRLHLRTMSMDEQAAFVDEERQIYTLQAA